MQYTVNEKVLPAYYQDFYFKNYKPVYISPSVLLRPNIIHALHYHHVQEIGICMQGQGTTHVDNRVYRFSKGDLQFVPAGVPHLSAADPAVETRWVWISIDAREALLRGGISDPDALLQLCANGFAGLFHPWEHPGLSHAIHHLQEITAQPDEYSETEQAFLLGQILLECARIGKATKPESVNMGYSGRLKPAILHIRENFHNSEAMREALIAKTCGLSASHFRAVFKQETGQSFQSFLMQTRLARAAYLLKTTDRRISQIAAEAGFGEVAYFNRVFLKTFQQTPSTFRKQNLSK